VTTNRLKSIAADSATFMRSLLRQTDGPITRVLVRNPGRFGLGQIPLKLAPDATTTTVCGYCSTGCGLNIHIKDGHAVNLSPTTEYPVNRGVACPKGWEALNVLKADDRATTALLRGENGNLEPVSWDRAMRTFAERFKDIQAKHGPESVAFLSTGQIVSEEMALLGSLAKFGMGMIHGDGNTRQCMATAVAAYKESFGFDAPPYTYDDFEQSDVLVYVGANPCIAHPILWERVWRNPNSPKIIVIDPRKTETAAAATTHLPIRPKSDLALLYSVAHVLIREGWVDRDFVEKHTNGFDDFSKHVSDYTPVRVAGDAGVDADQIESTARMIHEGKRVSFWWTMGVNQSHEGTRVAQAIINLALMTGNIGRPGTGANSITGQSNAMGSRLFSNTTNLLGGHSFTNPEDRSKVAGLLNIDAEKIPDKNSWAYHQIIEGIASEKIKGLWVIATNPAHSWIGQNDFADILDKLDFLVVQDMYSSTETARRADLLLPAAAWGEKDGTFINSERRIGLVKKVAHAPGEALTDFAIFKLIAHYWGCADMFADWDSPEAVFQILKNITRDQPCDITGISDYRMIDDCSGIQWPYTKRDAQSGTPETHRRLFEDGRFYHDDGKARFVFDKPVSMPEPADDHYPMLLMTGRGSASQWHTQTRTGKSAVLTKLYPRDIYIEVHPDDARSLSINPDEWVFVQSRRGRLRARAFITTTVKPGEVFIPMHYHETNRLTNPVFDPHSKQPSYKACAVRIRRIATWENTQTS
jgi:assimilatory nitrate reductase catalytic subunit